MVKRIAWLVAAFASVTWLSSRTPIMVADQPTVTGTWEMSWETPRGPMTITMELKQDGATLTGRVQTRGGWQEIKDGTIDGGSFSFTVEFTRQDRTFAMEYKGSLQDDGTLKGTLTTPRGESPWTAKRVEG